MKIPTAARAPQPEAVLPEAGAASLGTVGAITTPQTPVAVRY
ncbi:MAG TPA: hypothetical protein VG096_23265 [Bryobacteraceae bacterium]|nr:hypothetical protein [Bryobacteraceae bacterium]